MTFRIWEAAKRFLSRGRAARCGEFGEVITPEPRRQDRAILRTEVKSANKRLMWARFASIEYSRLANSKPAPDNRCHYASSV